MKSIDYCVHSVMSENGTNSTSDYQRLLQIAYRGFRELNLYLMPSIKTVNLPISDLLTVDLPDDYVSYTAIGVCVNGRIITLTLCDEICLARKVDSCGQTLPEVMQKITDFDPSNDFGFWFNSYFRNGQYVGEQYGATGGWNDRGYYRIDLDRNQIQFAGVIPKTEIVLEYKSNGLSCDGSASIPEELIEPLISYLHWKNIQNRQGLGKVGLGEKAMAKQDYLMQYDKAQHYIHSFTESEFLDMYYSHIKSSPKR